MPAENTNTLLTFLTILILFICCNSIWDRRYLRSGDKQNGGTGQRLSQTQILRLEHSLLPKIISSPTFNLTDYVYSFLKDMNKPQKLLPIVQALPKNVSLRESLFLDDLFRVRYSSLKSKYKKQILEEIFLNETGTLDFDVLPNYKVTNKGILRQRLPDIICIGAKKCGTEAFQNFITHHSRIKGLKGTNSEIHFFDLDDKFQKGVEYYKSFFPYVTLSDTVFEKTPRYFTTDYVPERIKQVYKKFGNGIEKHEENLKFLVILCNPSKRTFSDFKHTAGRAFEKLNLQQQPIRQQLDDRWENHNFEGYVEDGIKYLDRFDNNTDLDIFIQKINHQDQSVFSKFNLQILTNGIYKSQMESWLKHFKLSQFIFINGDDLVKNPGKILIKAQKAMNLDVEITDKDFIKLDDSGMFCYAKNGIENGTDNDVDCLNNRGSTTNKDGSSNMSERARKMLEVFFRPHNQALYDLVGPDFGKFVTD